MSEASFDSNILIDALNGHVAARAEIAAVSVRYISRITRIEVMSKVPDGMMRQMEIFLGGFRVDELDEDIADRAAALRRNRGRLKLADAIILASAQANGRILVTRNTKDFPVGMPGVRIPYFL